MKRKAVSGVILTLLLVGMLAWAFDIQPTKAGKTIYIRADGSVEGTTDTTTVDNIVHTFTNDISDSLVVERDDITIDGMGYTLQGHNRRPCGSSPAVADGVVYVGSDKFYALNALTGAHVFYLMTSLMGTLFPISLA